MRLSSSPVRLVLLVALVLADARQGRADPMVVTGTLVDMRGHPVAGAVVFGADVQTERIVTTGTTNAAGQVTFRLPDATKLLCGLVSPDLFVTTFKAVGPAGFLLVVDRWFRSPASFVFDRGVSGEVALRGSPFGITVLRGKVVDETGTALGGVRVVALGVDSKRIAGEARTRADGSFAIPVRDGHYFVTAQLMGLTVARLTGTSPQRLAVVMKVVAEAQEIHIDSREGHVLTFRLKDSIWPEYWPPPEAAAWLRAAYGINVNSMCSDLPLSVCVRRTKMQKYWWLDVLRTTPSNPAGLVTW